MPDTRVLLVCPDCPKKVGRLRDRFELDFPSGIPHELFIWTCPRGHRFAIRGLTRHERRQRPEILTAFVATRWEVEE